MESASNVLGTNPFLSPPSFCDDMFGNSGKNICKNPDTDDIDDFCDWLESNSKSFSNRDYFEGQCDGPSNGDKDFCDDVSVTWSILSTTMPSLGPSNKPFLLYRSDR